MPSSGAIPCCPGKFPAPSATGSKNFWRGCWEENLLKKYGSNALHLTTEFFECSLCQSVKETGDSLVEGYSSIDAMKESEHLFLLRCGSQQWFFVEKAGFVKGSAEDFRQFISGKIGG